MLARYIGTLNNSVKIPNKNCKVINNKISKKGNLLTFIFLETIMYKEIEKINIVVNVASHL